ncbi:DUF7848 domain-containing protein [[Kitasatospora] papulosa]
MNRHTDSTTTRVVTFKTTRDPLGEVTWAATCVSGEEEECGASTPETGSDEEANDWMAEHSAATGHRRFRRVHRDYATVEPQFSCARS